MSCACNARGCGGDSWGMRARCVGAKQSLVERAEGMGRAALLRGLLSTTLVGTNYGQSLVELHTMAALAVVAFVELEQRALADKVGIPSEAPSRDNVDGDWADSHRRGRCVF